MSDDTDKTGNGAERGADSSDETKTSEESHEVTDAEAAAADDAEVAGDESSTEGTSGDSDDAELAGDESSTEATTGEADDESEGAPGLERSDSAHAEESTEGASGDGASEASVEEPASSGGEDEIEEDLPSAWAEFRPLVLALLGSALLHGSLFGVPYLLGTFRVDLGVDVEWIDTEDQLKGVGQQSGERWAELSDMPAKRQKSASKSSESEQKQTKDDTPEKDDAEADESSSEKDDGEGPKDDEASDDRERTNEPDEESSSEEADSESEKQATRTADSEEKTPKEDGEADTDTSDDSTESSDDSPSPFADLENHPALNRAGPQDLPNMNSFAPGNARLTMLVRTDRMRGQPYASAIKRAVRAAPDFRLLFGGMKKFDPIADMDWMFLATSDPKYIKNYFFVVRHRLSNERLRGHLDRGYPDASWSDYANFDVRKLVPDSVAGSESGYGNNIRDIMLGPNGLALVANSDQKSEIISPLSDDSDLLTRAAEGEDPSSSDGGDDGRRPSLLRGLARIHRVAARSDTVVLMSSRGLKAPPLPGVGTMSSMKGARLRVTRPRRPTVDLDVRFSKPEAAQTFANKCPVIRSAALKEIQGFLNRGSGLVGGATNLLLGEDVGKLSKMFLNRLSCKADGQFVTVHGEYTSSEVKRIAEVVSSFVPSPASVSDIVRRREKVSHKQSGATGGADAGSTSDTGVARDAQDVGGASANETDPGAGPNPSSRDTNADRDALD